VPFPASLATITVTGSFMTYPAGGAGTGSVVFTNSNWLFSPGDNEIIAPFAAETTLDGSGNISVVLPATDDPQWTPQGWSYAVEISVGSSTLTGSLQLQHDGPSTVDISDFFNPGEPSDGVTYIPLTQRSIANGVAGLDADGDVIDADGDKIKAPHVGPSAPLSPDEGDIWFDTSGV